MAGDVSSVLDLITQGGLAALLLVIIWGGAKRMWVFGWVYEAMKQDRDEWREFALNGAGIAEKAVETAATATATGTNRLKRTRIPKTEEK